jgi:hypothetical protein
MQKTILLLMALASLTIAGHARGWNYDTYGFGMNYSWDTSENGIDYMGIFCQLGFLYIEVSDGTHYLRDDVTFRHWNPANDLGPMYRPRPSPKVPFEGSIDIPDPKYPDAR